MKIKNIYIILTIAGTLLPLSQFYQFLTENGLNFKLFFEELFVNNISSFFGLDVIISAIVTALFIAYESKRLHIKNSWICYIALFGVGVSCGLPLFLYLREKKLESHS